MTTCLAMSFHERILVMEQMAFGLDPLPKKMRKAIFLEEMDRVVLWSVLVSLIKPYARGAHQGLGGPAGAVHASANLRSESLSVIVYLTGELTHGAEHLTGHHIDNKAGGSHALSQNQGGATG